MDMIGNKSLLTYTKIGFLASRHIDVSEVMVYYEWASRKAEPKTTVVSGFSSKIEKDVLHFLLKAKTPVIWVIARKPYKVLPADIQKALDEGRLLIISMSNATRQSKELAYNRNEYVASISDRLIFTGITEESSLYPIYLKYKNQKPCNYKFNEKFVENS